MEAFSMDLRERGSIAAIDYQPGPKPKLSERQFDRMCLLLAEEPDLTAEEVRRRLRLPLSASRVSAILLEAGFTRKKRVLRADADQPRSSLTRRVVPIAAPSPVSSGSAKKAVSQPIAVAPA